MRGQRHSPSDSTPRATCAPNDCQVLVHERRLEEAHRVVTSILESRARWYGAEHHETLQALGCLANLLRRMPRRREADDEAEALERRVLDAGEALLLLRDNSGGGRPLCRFRSVMYVVGFFGEGAKKREHLMERASAFLCKAFLALKVSGLQLAILFTRSMHRVEYVEHLYVSAWA